MGNLPTDDELKAQLLKSIDEVTYAKDLATLQAQNNIYKVKPMLATSMIAKLHGIKLDFGLKFKVKEVDPNEIMPEGQWVTITQLKNTPYKIVNVRGWIVSIGKLGKTAKGDKAKITFALADATGVIDPIWIFGDEAENFSKMIDYSLGKAINIVHLAIKDNKDLTKNFYRCEKKTQISVCREPPCNLGAVNTGALANITDGYVTLKAMVISELEDIDKQGCPKYHYLDGEVGTTLPCSYCGGIPQTIVTYNAGRCLIADETSQLTMEVSGDTYNNNRPKLEVGEGYLIRGKFNNKIFYYYESYPIGKFESSTMGSAISYQKPTDVHVHQSTPEGDMWYAIKTRNYVYKKEDDPLLQSMAARGIIMDGKNDHHYTTLWDKWSDVEDLLKEQITKAVTPEKPLPTVALFLGEESKERVAATTEVIDGFVVRYKKMFAHTYPVMTKEVFYSSIGKNANQDYLGKLFLEALLVTKVAELVWQNNDIVLVAK